MKTYLNPSMDILFIETQDVITTSGGPVTIGGIYADDTNKGIDYGDLF